MVTYVIEWLKYILFVTLILLLTEHITDYLYDIGLGLYHQNMFNLLLFNHIHIIVCKVLNSIKQ